MLRDKNYYDILEVSKNATKKDIDTAYRKLVMKFHPDVYKGKDSNVKMKEINKAYEVLSNSDKKNQYDAYLSSGYATQDFDYQSDDSQEFQQKHDRGDNFFSQFSFNFGNNDSADFDFGNIFTNFFGKHKDGDAFNNNDYSVHNIDVNLVIDLTIEEWFKGVDKRVSYDILEKCKDCTKQKIVCDQCRGKKYFYSAAYGNIVCSTCNARGYRLVIKLCGGCNNGSVKKRVSTNFKISRFMQTRYVIQGGGNFNVKTQSNGDIVISIKILEHPNFYIDNNDICCAIDIGVEEYIYGVRVKFKYLDDSFISLDIKPFSSLSLEIDGKGVKHKKGRGKLFIQLSIVNNINSIPNMSKFKQMLNITNITSNFITRI
jgi:molecular chaperone DnaJ